MEQKEAKGKNFFDNKQEIRGEKVVWKAEETKIRKR